MYVKNIEATDALDCKCRSRIQHWRNFSNQVATECRVKGCTSKDRVGSYVQKAYVEDEEIYLVPMCYKHSHKEGVLELVAYTNLVPADKSQTCKK